MIEFAKVGRVVAQGADAQRKRSETQLRHKAAQREWHLKLKPSWLTPDFYEGEIQPRLASVSIPAIASALGVSIPYAADIRVGRRRPHPRYWQTLEKLVIATSRFTRKRVSLPPFRAWIQRFHKHCILFTNSLENFYSVFMPFFVECLLAEDEFDQLEQGKRRKGI